MRAVAYIRVSSLSQVDGHSLDAQERLIHELCKSRGWEEVRVYREGGRSADVEAIAKRPAFRKLLELPRLWDGATPEERRRLLLTVLDAVYVDTQGKKRVVEARPKAAFRAVWVNELGTSGDQSTITESNLSITESIPSSAIAATRSASVGE